MDELGKNMLESEDGNAAYSPRIPEDAFLVIEGFRVMPLLQEIIGIGRRFENKIVIDDPRISRYHAELRARDGTYELVDLNSTGGTYINGNKITESILYPGDVISLAGVTLIYRQHDVPPRADMKGTEPFSGSDPDGRSEPHFSSDES